MTAAYRVLIVEDVQDLANVIYVYLSNKTDAEIVLANSGNQAIDILDSETINLVITDLYMTNGNGIKVIEKARHMGIDVVVHSGVTKAYQLHIPEGIPLIEKPSKLEEILDLINEFRAKPAA